MMEQAGGGQMWENLLTLYLTLPYHGDNNNCGYQYYDDDNNTTTYHHGDNKNNQHHGDDNLSPNICRSTQCQQCCSLAWV